MSQTIKIKRSATSGNKLTASNSVTGEFGLNTADKSLYIQTGSTDASVVTVYDDSLLHLDDTNNRVGIGTTSPSKFFHIDGGTVFIDYPNGSGPSLIIGRKDSSNYWEVGHAGGDFRLYNTSGSGSDILLGVQNGGVDQGNKVGIGTATPGRKLTVQGGSGDNLPVRVIGGSGTDHGSMEFQDPNTTADYKVAIGSKTDDFYIQAGGIERVRVKATGKIGIGTAAPAGNLHIKSIGDVGDALLIIESDADNNVESDNPRIELRQDNNLVTGAVYLEGNPGQTATNTLSNSLILDAKASGGAGSHSIQFATGGLAANQSGGPTNSSVRITIRDDGKVGIGKNNPSQKLDIVGNVGISGTEVIDSSGNWVGPSSGLKGEPGVAGAKGQKGEAGTNGAKGEVGVKGQKGEAGATGGDGAAGGDGADGAKGQKGEAGTNGTDGTDGAKGQKGEVGAKGETGATGQKGEQAGITAISGFADNRVVTASSSTALNGEANLTFDGTTLSSPVLYPAGGEYDFTNETTDPTNAALIINKDDFIYNNNDGYARRMIGLTSGQDIEIGQSGTALIRDISLYTGTSGNIFFKTNNGTTKAKIDNSGKVYGQTFVANIANDTVSTTHAAFRTSSTGAGELDAPGHFHINIDSNNNNTDRYFSIRKDATTTDLFKVKENGNVEITGAINNGTNGWLQFNDDQDSHWPTNTDNLTVLGSTTHTIFAGDSNANGTGGIFYWGHGQSQSASSQTWTTTAILDRSGVFDAKGGLKINGSSVINSSGEWTGSSSGLKGEPGAAGSDGTNGTDGAKGDTGSKGLKGDGGDAGAKGNTGAKGQKGEAGANGTNGTNGAKGQKGEAGTNGTNGAKGQKGEAGTNGTNGAKGQKGEVGQKGAAGAKGQKGEVGQKGQKGAQGAKGQKGEQAGITAISNFANDRVVTATSSTALTGESNLTFNTGAFTASTNKIRGRATGTTATGSILERVIPDHSIENIGVLDYAHHNLLAGADQRFSVTSTLNGSSFTTASDWFRGPSKNGGSHTINSGSDMVILIENIPTATYGTYVGVAFGHSNFRAQGVKIETFRNGAWQTECDISNNSDNLVARGVSGNNGNGVTKVKYTFSNPINTYIRINMLFMLNYQTNSSTDGYYVNKYANSTITDDNRVNFGTNNDSQIYHNGTDLFIDESDSGKIFIRSSDEVRINKYTGEFMIRAIADGAVELYHNHAKKLDTNSLGVTVTGTTVTDGLDLNGNGDISGILTFNPANNRNALDLKNNNILGVNKLSFSDPGPNEGLQWTNIKMYEAPNDLTTNTAGNLQVVYGSTRRLTVDSTGIDVNGNVTISGTEVIDSSGNWTGSVAGFKGEVGEKGDTGAKGQKGEAGAKGQKGEVGSKGNTGATGTGITMEGQVATTGNLPSSGNTKGDAYIVQADDSLHIWDGSAWVSGGSIQGPQGSKGQKGATGAKGEVGQKGATGQKGEVGQKGAAGAKGQKGQGGTNGTDGTNGTNGDKGAPGAKGAAGAKGQKGEVGQKGAAGAKGQKGEVGVKGQKGAQAGITSISNFSDNRVLTASSGTAINGEANLTFDGTNLNTGRVTTTSGDLLRAYRSSWTNAPTHTILYNGWWNSTSDYIVLKVPGNNTSGHGALLVADNGTYFGRTNVETGTGINDSATAPLDGANWGYVNSTGIYSGGKILTADGSQSAPTHTFTNDTNTGMYSSASDILEFSTGGVRRGYFNDAGITSFANVYTSGTSSFRNYGSAWKASTGLTGNGFSFENSVDGTAMTISSTGDVVCTGSLSATTKSFDIEHPTKEGMRLHHGSLEGPEHGVYIRGRNKGTVIELPEYWLGLVDEDTITVQLTAIGEPQNLCVADIKDNKVYVKGVEYFYFVQAERKDIEKFEVEYAG